MKKIESFLYYALVFLLPTQFGHFFFLPSSYINGLGIDYLAPAVYLTDILICVLCLFHWSKLYHFFKKRWYISLLIVVVNIIFSINKEITLYKWIKLYELLALFILVRDFKWDIKKIYTILLATTLLQLLLALLQISTQGALQGIFYFLGERYLTISTPGIAKVSFEGFEILRPYGTFSHPNSLAGFFLLVYSFILFKIEPKINPLKLLLLITTSFLILISFSKITIAIYSLVNIIYAFLITKKTCGFCMVSRIIVYSFICSLFFFFHGDPDSITKRLQLMQNAFEIIIHSPLTGIGLGTYVVAQSNFPILYSYFFLQPVHNIYLLLIAELGLPINAFLFYVVGRYVYANKKNLTILIVVLTVGLTGIFDHYWLTLQQNMLLIPIILGFLYSRNVIK